MLCCLRDVHWLRRDELSRGEIKILDTQVRLLRPCWITDAEWIKPSCKVSPSPEAGDKLHDLREQVCVTVKVLCCNPCATISIRQRSVGCALAADRTWQKKS